MDDIEVLIVGAGPSGLTAACALRQAGVSTLIVDTAQTAATTSRAAVIHARTLEVLEDLHLTPALLDEGIIVPEFTIRDRNSVVARLDFSDLPTAYPFTLMLPQSRIEALLAQRLDGAGGAVERGTTLESLHHRSGGIDAVLVRGDGSRHRVHARFVIGADGAHSAVRDQIAVAVRGNDYRQPFVLADVVLRWHLPTAQVHLFLAPDGLMVVAPLPGDRHRIVATVNDAPAHPTRADIQHLLDTRGPADATVTSVVWSSRFRVAHRLAEHYRVGNVFLVGDAAHVHSPAGGQGMNTGIQDAVDLAATLVGVLRRGMPDASTDEYETRRRPIAGRVITLTDRMTRAATLRAGWTRTLRNLLIRAALRSPRARTALAMRIAELSAPMRTREPRRATPPDNDRRVGTRFRSSSDEPSPRSHRT